MIKEASRVETLKLMKNLLEEQLEAVRTSDIATVPFGARLIVIHPQAWECAKEAVAAQILRELNDCNAMLNLETGIVPNTVLNR